MADKMIHNVIVNHDEKKLRIPDMPAETTVKKLIAWSIERLNIPTVGEHGENIVYGMLLLRTNSNLINNSTLIAQSIQDNDELEFFIDHIDEGNVRKKYILREKRVHKREVTGTTD